MVVRFNFKNGGLTKPSLSPVTHTLANNLLLQAFCWLSTLTSARLELQNRYANKQTSLFPVWRRLQNSTHIVPSSSNNLALKIDGRSLNLLYQTVQRHIQRIRPKHNLHYQTLRRQRLGLQLHTKLYDGKGLAYKYIPNCTASKAYVKTPYQTYGGEVLAYNYIPNCTEARDGGKDHTNRRWPTSNTRLSTYFHNDFFRVWRHWYKGLNYIQNVT